MPVRHVLTVLAVADLARSVRFYTQAFGWAISVEVPVYVELALPHGMGLGLYERRGFGANPGVEPVPLDTSDIAGAELYLVPDDLDATVDALREAGATELSPPALRSWGDEVAYFRDPDGIVVAVARPGAETTTTSVVQRWMRAWEAGDPSFIEATHGPDFVDHAPGSRPPTTEGFITGHRALYAAFPDFRAHTTALSANAEQTVVTVRWTATGTHRGPFLGVDATGRRVHVTGIEVLHVEHGRIVARWGEWDGLGLLQQLTA